MKKIQIRRGVFETNSSSTHSLTICSKEDFEKFKNGELVLNWKDKLVKKTSENEEECTNYEDWVDGTLETFKESYITKNGDEVVAFGLYGYNS